PRIGYSHYYHLSKSVKNYIEIGGSIFMLEDKKGKDYVLKQRRKMRKLAKKYFVIGSNFGPFYFQEQLVSYNNFFKETNGVVFRDKKSFHLFSDLSNVSLAPDVVFNYSLREKKLNNGYNNYIVISVINLHGRKGFSIKDVEMYENWLEKVCSHFVKLKKKVVLMGFCESERDNEVLNRIKVRLDPKLAADVIYYTHKTLNESLQYMYNAELIIATRFHAMILGWLFSKPTFVISYSPKIIETIKTWFPKQAYTEIFQLNDYNYQNIQNDATKIPNDCLNELIKAAENQFKYVDLYLNSKNDRTGV
ncbi:polysaccharide pyruvyl transferase family protein, partial [Enterococcus faecium]|nr:polysaccharide pyruvyl transferase family protein [Enterococcus faecium]